MRENEYDVPVIAPDFIPLLRFTYHVDPVGRPDSVNVTEYVTSENVMGSESDLPFTVNDPGYADGS